MFASTNEGKTVSAEELEMESTIILNEDGTGVMTSDDDMMDVTSWTEEDGILTITLADGGVASGELSNGILNLDVMSDGTIYMLYAQEGADTSVYKMMTLEEYWALEESGTANDTAVAALFTSLDPAEGVHLNYSVHHDYMDSDDDVDSVGKGNHFYSAKTTHVNGITGSSYTLYLEGKAYNLDPEAKTATFVTETDPSALDNNAVMMDPLYSAILMAARNADVTEESREKDGVTYHAVIVPATEDQEESVFYFNEDGSLAFYLHGSYQGSGGDEIGASLYTVNTIDSTVDEALFDLSSYEVR